MQTPRLCIDARAAGEFAPAGDVAQELIDQLVAAVGEPGITSPWMERSRTVLVAHPNQIFSGQLRRFNTRRRIGGSPLYWMWERGLVKDSGMRAFHRFRPLDRLWPKHSTTATVTTVLPARRGYPFFIPKGHDEIFVVPSEADSRLLVKRYGVSAKNICVVRPGIRRYAHFSEGPKRNEPGHLLVLDSGGMARRRLHAALRVLKQRFPQLAIHRISLSRHENLTPAGWLRLLSDAALVVSLGEAPFDWPTAVLEAIYWRVPTLFSDRHHALGELIPSSGLSLSRFLVDMPSLAQLSDATDAARARLETDGIFAPLATARQYAQVYERLPSTAAVH